MTDDRVKVMFEHYSIMSCRLVLNLRDPKSTAVNSAGVNGGQSFWSGRSAVMNPVSSFKSARSIQNLASFPRLTLPK